ncbi:MAG: phosphatase PAP2 family protein [Pikeienuella sp.]
MIDILHDTEWVLAYRSDMLTPVFEVFTWFGYSTFYLLFLPLGYWLWSKPAFTRLAILVATSAVINAFLKDWIQDPRPDLAFSLDPRTNGDFGMPSGHAQVSSAMWIWLAYEVRRWWMWAFSTLMVVGICTSRVYLGVHDLEDIFAGLALGATALGLTLTITQAGVERIGPIGGAAIMLVGQVIVFLSWNPQHPPGDVSIFGGFCIAWLIGVWSEQKRLNYQPPVDPVRKAAVAGIGTVILVALFLGFKKFAGVVEPEGYRVLYIGAAIIAFYMTFLAPLLFKRLRLSA